MNTHGMLTFALNLLATAWLCGCAAKTPQEAVGPEPAATIKMRFHSFEPEAVTVRAGQAVRWQNNSIIWHTVTDDLAAAKDPQHAALPPGAQPFDSGKVKPGQAFYHTFTVPGTYRYFCRPHESSGMLGRVVVEPADQE